MRLATVPAEAGQVAHRDRPSIAVATFLSLGSETLQDVPAEGFTADITSAMCCLPGFLVIARGTMFAYQGPRRGSAPAGQLGVRCTVGGRVRVHGRRLRVGAPRIDAASGHRLRAQDCERKIDELFAIQDDIARHIAGRIEPEMLVAGWGRASRKPRASLSGWECVVRALHHSTQPSELESRKATELLQQALAHDPAHAQALGMLAWLVVIRAFQGWEPMPEAPSRAETWIARATAIDADGLWTVLAQGMVGFATRDEARALRVLRRAVQHYPSSVNAHGLLGVALASVAQAMRLSPRDTYLSDHDLYQAFALFQLGRHEAALQHAVQAARLRSGRPFPLVLATSCAGRLPQGLMP